MLLSQVDFNVVSLLIKYQHFDCHTYRVFPMMDHDYCIVSCLDGWNQNKEWDVTAPISWPRAQRFRTIAPSSSLCLESPSCLEGQSFELQIGYPWCLTASITSFTGSEAIFSKLQVPWPAAHPKARWCRTCMQMKLKYIPIWPCTRTPMIFLWAAMQCPMVSKASDVWSQGWVFVYLKKRTV